MDQKEKFYKRYNIDPDNLPSHIAIIMDGNGRWADRRNLPRVMGHHAGIESVRAVVKACSLLGIQYLTLYTFSTENWIRPKDEVNALMVLLEELLRSELDELHKKNVRVRAIGRIHELPAKVRRALDNMKQVTSNNTGLTLVLALNYGGRQEIVDGINKILNSHDSAPVTIETFRKCLYDSTLPYPDLIIRTSGEVRLSNFLIWQAAYSEIWITRILWPDFRRRHLCKAIVHYQKRVRKFGGINA